MGGYREVLGAAEGIKEDKAGYWLHGYGPDGVKLIGGDKCLGMLEAVGEMSPSSMTPTWSEKPAWPPSSNPFP